MDLGEEREETGPEARLSCVLRGSESGRVPILPCLPQPTPSFLPSLPPSICWPAPLRASRGRFLPQLGVLGCVAACLYWSVDFLVAACTYLNIPPAAALCSWPRTAPSPPTSPPPCSLCSLSHTHFMLYHSACPLVIPIYCPLFPLSLFLISCILSSPHFHLSYQAVSFIAAFSRDSVHFHPLL